LLLGGGIPAAAVEVSDSDDSGYSSSSGSNARPAQQDDGAVRKAMAPPKVDELSVQPLVPDMAKKVMLRHQLEQKQRELQALRSKLMHRQLETSIAPTSFASVATSSGSAALLPPPPLAAKPPVKEADDVVIVDGKAAPRVEKAISSPPSVSTTAQQPVAPQLELESDEEAPRTALALASKLHNERLNEQKRRLYQLMEKRRAGAAMTPESGISASADSAASPETRDTRVEQEAPQVIDLS
jgi:hypothetical protein